MILPAILSLVLMTPQDPGGPWCTVSAANDQVAPRAVASIQREVEPAIRRLREVFPEFPRQRFAVVVHRSADDLPAGLRPFHHEGSPGFAMLGRHEVHLMLAEVNDTPAGLRAVLEHEFTHEFLDQACAPFGNRIPRWFHEGLAQVVAKDTYLGVSEEAIVWRVASHNLLPLAELAEGFPHQVNELRIAYAQSYSYVAWLERKLGLPKLVAMARSVGKDRTFEQALVVATDRTTAELTEAWRDHVLNGSGATWRVILQQFFALSMILALPLLALAMIRRQRADRMIGERMANAETAAAAVMPEPMPEPDGDYDADADIDDDPEGPREGDPEPAPGPAPEDESSEPESDTAGDGDDGAQQRT